MFEELKKLTAQQREAAIRRLNEPVPVKHEKKKGVGGRPKGSGKTWTDFMDASVWARMKFIMERDGHSDVKRAAGTLVNAGHSMAFAGPRKLWLSREPKPEELARNKPLTYASENYQAADKRNENPAEVLRTRFYAAEKHRKADAAFREDCRFWLAYQREYHRLKSEGKDDPMLAFDLALQKLDS